jgi:cellulose synthase/poly-beta-1,6-N-acetylglucosamine synthase-like glycosyltransferase
MKRHKWLEIWRFEEARDIRWGHKLFLLILVVTGILSIGKFADWWFRDEHIGFLPLYIILSLTVWHGMIRLIFIWINYLGISKPEHVPAEENLRVAIFTTSSPGEPLSMFDKTLEACARITYPHTTYLLDDTQDPAFKAIAEKHGAVWLELVGLPGAKAGKVNKAIEMTDEEYILIMDPDHIPFPNFLDNVLGYFKDDIVGFVQVAQAYYNQYRSFTAKGAAEQTYTFYGPTLMGLYGYGASVAIGANCTFRRRALESIGGHGVGLAEDLVTSIRLHAKGWKSVFVPKVVSRGLVPEDFGSFCKQQLKWSRGVHEVLFDDYPKLFKTLSFWQRISYFLIGTYYLVGVTSFVFFLFPYLYFWGDLLPARMYFTDFLINILPVGIMAVAVYLFVQNWLSHHKMERGLHLRGMVLKFASWPVFFIGFILSVVNVGIPYIPTAKKADVGHISPFARPLVIQLFIFITSVIYVVYKRRFLIPESELTLTSEITWGMMAFAVLAIIMVIGGLLAAGESKRLKVEEPWANVELDDIVIGENKNLR